MSYNYNPSANRYYRSTLYAILTINVGYNLSTSQIVVRPKLDVISNYRGSSTTADSKISVVCEGGSSERNVNTFENERHVYIYFSREQSSIASDSFKIKITQLN